MEQIKFSVFDMFAYIIPGAITVLASLILIEPSIVHLVDLIKPFQNMDLGVAIVAIVVAYVIGFAIDSPGSWLYYSIGCKVFGPPYKLSGNGLSHSQKRALVRQFSPENHVYIQLWKVIKTMSHNLSLSSLLLAVVSFVQVFRVPAPNRTEWVILSIVVFLLSVIFLHRAHVFDTWHYDDLSSTVQVLQLEKKALQEMVSKPEERVPG